MRVCTLAIASLLALAAATTAAFATEATDVVGADGVSFVDTAPRAAHPPLQLTLRADYGAARFASLAPEPRERVENTDANRTYELELSAQNPAGLPVDVAIAQRASFGVDSAGDISRHGRGSELRLGRGINMRRWQTPSWDAPALYMFIASDDEALTWTPGASRRGRGGGSEFALQDRVEIGDAQIGVTLEAGGLQASLAYVEREVSARTGTRTISRDENFAGLTITMRR